MSAARTASATGSSITSAIAVRALLSAGLLLAGWCADAQAQTNLPTQAREACVLDGKAIDLADPASFRDRTGMMVCKDSASGQLLREQELRSGALIGAVRIFENGKLAQEWSVDAKGRKDGVAREFGPGGALLRETRFDAGVETGITRSFYPDGTLRRAGFHGDAPGERAAAEFTPRGQLAQLKCGDEALLSPVVDDARLCGFTKGPSRVELFDEKGLLRGREAWSAGKRIRADSFYDNGKLATEEETNGNQRIERRFSSEGVKRVESVSDVKTHGPVKQVQTDYSETGVMLREQRWNAQAEPVGERSFYADGRPRSEATYSGGGERRVDDLKTWHENGALATQGRFSAKPGAPEVPIDIHQRFDEAGHLIAEAHYDAQGRVTRERAWDANGTLLRDEALLADGSRKAFGN